MKVFRDRKYVIWVHDASSCIGVDLREEFEKMQFQNDLYELNSSGSLLRARRWKKIYAEQYGLEDSEI